MGSLVFTLILVAAVLAWLWKRHGGAVLAFAGSKPQARVVFRAGRVVECEGRIPRATLSAFEDIAAHADLDGEARLLGGAEIEFSDEIPPGVRQQLRNALVTSIHVH